MFTIVWVDSNILKWRLVNYHECYSIFQEKGVTLNISERWLHFISIWSGYNIVVSTVQQWCPMKHFELAGSLTRHLIPATAKTRTKHVLLLQHAQYCFTNATHVSQYYIHRDETLSHGKRKRHDPYSMFICASWRVILRFDSVTS